MARMWRKRTLVHEMGLSSRTISARLENGVEVSQKTGNRTSI
jgi:hypothetical protein